jgi:uncharacterized protein (TIGR02996 family)
MSDQQGLLRDICDRPDDDGPRLIYADWLDDHGEHDRADFIRLQLRLATAPEFDPDFVRARHLRWELFFGHPFRRALPALPAGLRWPDQPFQRGFPEVVAADKVSAFLDGAEQLFAIAPIRHLELDLRNCRGPFVPRLAYSPWLARLRSLDLKLGELGAIPMRRLGESPHATGLERLALPFGGVVPAGVEALVDSPLFPRLTELDLHNTDYAAPVGPMFAAAVERVSVPCRLEKLSLRSTRFGPQDVEPLASSPALSSLKELDLSECSYDRMLGEAGYRALVQSPHLRQLHTLRLAKTGPQLGGLRALLESPALKNLRELDLSSNNLGKKAAELLAAAPALGELRVLHLNSNDLGDKAVEALASSPHLTRLVLLGLRRTKCGLAGGRALAASPNLADVVALQLWDNKLGAAAKALQKRFGERVRL